MSRKMTVVFHDEELYTELKVEAARRHIAASEIISDAVRQWMEAQEDEELLPVIEARLNEYNEKGARSWGEVESEWKDEVMKRERLNVVAEKKDVQP